MSELLQFVIVVVFGALRFGGALARRND
jgi:hypothetical protein